MTEVWNIERIVPGGEGFARLEDGRAGFARGAVPGDRIRPVDVQKKKSWARARRWELVQPSPERVEAACPVADQCGGCDLMHLGREAQLREKVGILRDALGRIGRFRNLPETIPIVSEGPSERYRSRLRLHVDDQGAVGLYRRHTRDVVEIPGCVVTAPGIDEALEAVRQAGKQHPGALACFSDIEIRAAIGEEPTSLRFHLRTETARANPLLEDLSEQYDVSVARRQAGRAQRWPLPGGVDLLAPPAVFTQVNWPVNRALVSWVVDGAVERGSSRFCDLYCGAGNFSLPLLRAGLSGIGIDRAGAAIDAARISAREADLTGATFEAGEVPVLARGLDGPFDVVVVDPPRTGAAEVLSDVLRVGSGAIAMVSCDPPTLARDLRRLADAGWVVESIRAFDMFPHTHHVEAVVWLASPKASDP